MARRRVAFRSGDLPVAEARSLPETPSPGRVESDEETGLPLRVTWIRGDGVVHAVADLGFLRRAPGMAPRIAETLAKHYTTKSSPVTIAAVAEKLAYGLVPFLDHPERRGLGVGEFTLEHAHQFDQFVEGLRISDAVKYHRWDAARTMLHRCGGIRLAPARWRSTRPPGDAKGLNAGELRQVLSAAVREAMQTVARFDAQFDPDHARWGVEEDVERLEVLVELRRHFAGRFPNEADIVAADPELWRRVHRIGWNELRWWWGPTPASVGAFLVLWLYWFRLNPTLAQRLRVGQVDLVDGEWVVFRRKCRGGRRQTPGYPDGDEPLGPAAVKEFLARWTEPVRRAGPVGDRRHMFLVWNWPTRPTSNLEGRGIMTTVFKEFRRRHGIARLTAGLLRPAAIDVVGELTGDDVDFRAATGIHTKGVNRRSYRLPDAELRDRVRVGMMLSVRRRDYLSHPATAAVTRVGRAGWQAATPGWRCADPTSRRFSSTAPGGLCDAVGRCPACHLGEPVLDCGYSLAHSLAVLAAAEAELASGSPERMGAYAPVVDRLETRWLPSFTDAARATMPDRVPSLVGCLS